jgi:macrolide transport system ATP-binding/permease protein
VLGVLLSLGLGQLINKFAGGNFSVAYSSTSIIAAFVCSTLIGVVFGFLPAKNAAKLSHTKVTTSKFINKLSKSKRQ